MKKYHLIRLLDIVISLFALIIFFPLMFIIFCLIFLENRSPIFLQKRVGKNMREFNLIKFRTMPLGTKSCPTHLVNISNITKLGSFLRKSKLDEIPQFWNVLKGEMTLVGPRPCLFSQKDLLKERQALNIHKIKPGITGVAQIKGIDMSNPLLLAETEYEMIKNLNLFNYIYLLLLTFIGNGIGDKTRN
tara:strand:+ start:192 stop:758 length:567 start_codon:yes stop_codon:yes gene_type:complete